jgi:hypothetical protein
MGRRLDTRSVRSADGEDLAEYPLRTRWLFERRCVDTDSPSNHEAGGSGDTGGGDTGSDAGGATNASHLDARSMARFYLALASNDGDNLTVHVNGTSIGAFDPPGNQSDAGVRLGSHGAFWDASIAFAASALKAGANTLTITSTGGTLEWDYVRLESDGS